MYERNADGRRHAARKRVSDLEARIRELEGGVAARAGPSDSSSAFEEQSEMVADAPVVSVTGAEGDASRLRSFSDASSAGPTRRIPQNFNTGNLHIVRGSRWTDLTSIGASWISSVLWADIPVYAAREHGGSRSGILPIRPGRDQAGRHCLDRGAVAKTSARCSQFDSRHPYPSFIRLFQVGTRNTGLTLAMSMGGPTGSTSPFSLQGCCRALLLQRHVGQPSTRCICI